MSKTPHAQKEKSPAHSHIPFKVLLPPSIIRSGPTTLRASPKTNHRQRWRINVNIEFPSIDELHHRKKSRCTPTSALAVNLSPGLRLHPDTRQNNKSRKDGSPVSKLSPLRFFFSPGRIFVVVAHPLSAASMHTDHIQKVRHPPSTPEFWLQYFVALAAIILQALPCGISIVFSSVFARPVLTLR